MKVFKGLALAALLASPLSANAANSVLSDVFDGSEPRLDPLPGSCSGQRDPLAYQDAGSFQVAESGTYYVHDAYQDNPGYFDGVEVTVFIYDGGFDPQNPLNNLVTPEGIFYDGFVELIAGRNYHLVVQHWCKNEKGAWAVTFSGPGNVTSAVSRVVPLETQGVIISEDMRADTECGDALRYQQTGPVQVQQSGTYYYSDIFTFTDVDACLQVYTAAFDPANPNANRVGEAMDDFGTVELQAGRDYYFVVQALDFGPDTGEYFYLLAPQAPFGINKALAGGWFNPQTNGQGFFVDVYEGRNEMFVGWYTFDLDRPVDGTAQLGEPGHRWLTAYGATDGATGDLDVYLARGGAFDSTSPPIETPQTVVGSMNFEFTGCMEGQVDYTLTQPAVSGVIPIQPLSADHVELCESLTEKPGVPGPL
jgi:hypothetical protein